MDLQGDSALSGTNLLIIDIDHLLAIQPSLYVIALNFNTHSVPITKFQDILFLVRNLDQPATTIRLIDTTCVLTFRSDLYLPAVYFNALLDELANENAGVSVGLLFEFNSQVEIIVILAGCQIAIFLVWTTLAN